MRRVAEAGAIPAETERSAEPSQYLAFRLEGETFAIRILVIREIIEHRPLTRVPMMPPWICGVINLRGAAVPVVDLATRFGRSPTRVTKRTCIVIVDAPLGGASRPVGLVVDTVEAVLEILPRDIEPVPAFGVKIDAELLAGVGKIEGRFVSLLNLDRVVAARELDGAAAAG